jgi:drug/metabolite transporter (DMT)-like permease
MMQRADYRPGQGVAIVALLTGASIWGLIWYPYRLLEAAGLAGGPATTLTYLVALLLGVALFWSRLRHVRVDPWLVAIALSAAGCNFGYVLATLHGQVMRVLLLFYLAPLWTVLLARLLLAERLTASGGSVVLVSMVGAAVMLWRPELGTPWPATAEEWLAVMAGVLFALSNVLIRRASHYSIELKSVAVFAGVVVLGLASPLVLPPPVMGPLDLGAWVVVGLLGVVLLAVNLVVQYGLTEITAGRAVVLLLFELVVAAIGSWLLAGEAMTTRECLGGSLIVIAGLIAARQELGT